MKGIGNDDEYWAALADGQLKLQRCENCSSWHWPAVWRCGTCGSWDQRWEAVEATGTLYSWTRTWYDFGAPKELALPLVSVLVELDGADGVRLLGTFAANAGEPAIGQRVTGAPVAVSFEGESLLAWRWTRHDGTCSSLTEERADA